MVMSIGQRRLGGMILVAGFFGIRGYAVAAGQDARQVPQLSVGRLADGEERPVIDGRVGEAICSTAQPFTGFIQQEPDEGEP